MSDSKNVYPSVADMSPMEFFDHCRVSHPSLRIYRTMNHTKAHKSPGCGHIHTEGTPHESVPLEEGSDA